MVIAPQSSYKSNIKFLCSYGGRILPRYPNGKLRYHGGQTRVIAVDRSVPFSELMERLKDMCAAATSTAVSLRCQLPDEDLDALVSITSDEDLSNIIEEYDRFAPQTTVKIRAFLSLSFPNKHPTAPPSSASSSSEDSSTSPPKPRFLLNRGLPPKCPIPNLNKPPVYPNLGKYKNVYYGGGGRQYIPCCRHHVYVSKG